MERETLENHTHVGDKHSKEFCVWTELDGERCGKPLFRRDPEIKGLAEALHKTLCRLDHTDQCAWDYEEMKTYPTATWIAWTHNHYYDRAQRLADSLGPDVPPGVIVMVLEAM